MRQSLEHQRLKAAYDLVCAITEKKTEYKAAAEAAPMVLRQLSLGPGLATLYIEDKQNAELADAVSNWLLLNCPWKSKWRGDKNLPQDIFEWIKQADRFAYRAAHLEAMAYLLAIKRFASAMFDEALKSEAQNAAA